MSQAVTRILMLHGYSQNGSIFSKRMGAIRKVCGKDVEFVFADGALTLQPADFVFGGSHSHSHSLQSLGAAEVDSEQDPLLTPRGWWNHNRVQKKAVGLEESLGVLRDVLVRERFDGVFGFRYVVDLVCVEFGSDEWSSQGAAMAALLSALLERPHVYPPFLVNGEAPHPPFKFCVVVSGFQMDDPIANAVMDRPFHTPTLHVIGTTDVIISEERSKVLAELSENKRVEVHTGGHFVPSKSNWQKFFKDYFRDPLGDVVSPGVASSVSNSNSGTATPIELLPSAQASTNATNATALASADSSVSPQTGSSTSKTLMMKL